MKTQVTTQILAVGKSLQAGQTYQSFSLVVVLESKVIKLYFSMMDKLERLPVTSFPGELNVQGVKRVLTLC